MSTICIFRDKESAEAVKTDLSELRALLSVRAKSMFLCTIIMDVYSMIRNRKINELTDKVLQTSMSHYPLEDPYDGVQKLHGLFFDDVLALSSLSPELKKCLEVPLFTDDDQRRNLLKAIRHLTLPSPSDFDRWMTANHRTLWENYKRFATDLNGPHPTVEKDVKKARMEYLNLMAEKGYDRKNLDLLGYLEVLEKLCLQKKNFAVF